MSDEVTPGAPIAVTGATGGLGGRVAARLAAAGARQRLVVRDAARAPRLPGADVAVVGGYDDVDGMVAALAGARTLLLVSASEHPDRTGQHAAAVDAAVRAGVERVVYTSFLGASLEAAFTFARDHAATEDALAASGLRWCALRDSLYVDALPGLAVPADAPDPDGSGGDGADGALAPRVVRGPGGSGRFAPVSRDDAADAATAALLDASGSSDRVWDLTGPVAASLAEVAALLAGASGVAVAYEEETLAQARASRAGYGAPDWEVEGWISTYTAIAAGEMDVVTDHVERLTGHPPVSIAAWLAAHPQALAALRG